MSVELVYHSGIVLLCHFAVQLAMLNVEAVVCVIKNFGGGVFANFSLWLGIQIFYINKIPSLGAGNLSDNLKDYLRVFIIFAWYKIYFFGSWKKTLLKKWQLFSQSGIFNTLNFRQFFTKTIQVNSWLQVWWCYQTLGVSFGTVNWAWDEVNHANND